MQGTQVLKNEADFAQDAKTTEQQSAQVHFLQARQWCIVGITAYLLGSIGACSDTADQELRAHASQWQRTTSPDTDLVTANKRFNGSATAAAAVRPLLQGVIAARPQTTQAWLLLALATAFPLSKPIYF